MYLMTHDNPARVLGLGLDEKPPAASRDGLSVGMAM